MGFDLLGQLFGKDKRRQMEAQAASLVKPVQVALPIIGSRLAAVGLASILGAAIKGGIPHDAQGLSAVAGTAFGAVMLAAPDAFQASGILRAVSPGTVSLVQAAGNALSSLASAPKAQRTQEIQNIATQAALAAVVQWQNKTDEFNAAKLGAAALTPDGKVLTPGQLAGTAPLPAGFAVTDPQETTSSQETAAPVPTPILTASAPIVTSKE